jgi:RimJ/RimL family protein N-acetyltransferase
VLTRQAAQNGAVGFCQWCWRERASGRIIGQAGLNRARIEAEPVVEIGWSIVPDRWGEGLATEAARASLDWGFDVTGLERIVAWTLPENEASRGVMERAGLSYVRHLELKGLPQVLYELHSSDR